MCTLGIDNATLFVLQAYKDGYNEPAYNKAFQFPCGTYIEVGAFAHLMY